MKTQSFTLNGYLKNTLVIFIFTLFVGAQLVSPKVNATEYRCTVSTFTADYIVADSGWKRSLTSAKRAVQRECQRWARSFKTDQGQITFCYFPSCESSDDEE